MLSPFRTKKLLILGLSLSLITTLATAKDFMMQVLPHAKKPTYDLNDAAKKMSYYDYVRNIVGKKMLELAPQAKNGSTNESELAKGNGVSVKLSQNNYNVHINFPMKPEGGRSYGWTAGQIGDWSDKMYLDNLYKGVVTGRDAQNMRSFYELVIQTLGASNINDSKLSIESLSSPAQRVASNFLAIYTAEAYRNMVPNGHDNWDDALLQTTLLGAFHGGQSQFAIFYTGKFTSTTKKQDSGVYSRGKPGVNFEKASNKPATMYDYWQFSAQVDSKQSGINITRNDFEKMGRALTMYATTVGNYPSLARVQSVVGKSSNVISSIAKFFTEGRSRDLSKIDQLSVDVAELMLAIHDDADKISAWISSKTSSVQ